MDAQPTGNKISASKNDNDARNISSELLRKIFVGGLSWESTSDDLREYFQQFGEVLDVTLKTDITTGKSRGFGFVLFQDVSTVDKVVAERCHFLHGKNIDPKRAVAGGMSVKEGIKKIFVGGLDPSLTKEEITEHFSQYGKVEQVELPYDKTKNQRRAFGFITFESADVVDTICSNPKVPFRDKMVDVRKAAPKDQQEGGFMGPGGRGSQRGRGGRGGGPPQAAGYQSSYDYNGAYPTAYPGYDYYGQPAGSYAPAPSNPGYDSSYYGQGWSGGGYDGAPGAGYDAGYQAGGYNYGSGWSGDAAGAAQGQGGGFGRGKRGGGTGQPTRFHPYNR